LSLPGSPIIYYGDEIGMGDNFYLGDRNGVRTPMQWSPDRNAGFSRADPQRLYLPPIMDPVYGYQAVNVEAQRREPYSLLNWMRRLIAVRKTHRAFGRGGFTMLHPGNRKVFAYVRQHEHEVILCAANLARSAQPVELDLSRFRGCVPVELLGGTPFPPIGELPYFLTLPGHGFYWFRLTPEAEAPGWHQLRVAPVELPVLVLTAGLASFFPERVGAARAGGAETLRRQIEREAIPRFLPGQRWFTARDTRVEAVRIEAMAEWSTRTGTWLLAVVGVETADGAPQSYLLPLALAWEGRDEETLHALAPVTVARVRQRARMGILYDAFADDAFCRALLSAIGTGERVALGQHALVFSPTTAYPGLVAALPAEPAVRRLSEASNNAIVFGERLLLKGSRRLRPELACEVGMGRYLTEHAPEVRAVPVGGSVELQEAGGTATALAALQGYLENQGDAWSYTQGYLERFLNRPLAPPPDRRLSDEAVHASYCLLMTTLGRRTAELHAVLATPRREPHFAPEPIAPDEPAAWSAAVVQQAETTLQQLRQTLGALSGSALAAASAVLAGSDGLGTRLAALGSPVAAVKTRLHGDFHLARALIVGSDVVLTGCGAEPARSPEGERWRHSPLQDVAGMLHSIHRARTVAVLRLAAEGAADRQVLEPLARAWETVARTAFLAGYRERIAGSPAWPSGPGEADRLLTLFTLERALRQVHGDLAGGCEPIAASLEGLLGLMETLAGAGAMP
jgi:maltose alpha-D-glucosyltransferase/alpha-amylase